MDFWMFEKVLFFKMTIFDFSRNLFLLIGEPNANFIFIQHSNPLSQKKKIFSSGNLVGIFFKVLTIHSAILITRMEEENPIK
jgi:hypothetical protein